MRRVITTLAVVATFFAATEYSSAQSIIWDQQPDTTLTGVINQDIPEPQSAFSTYLVNDATFSSNVTIDSVTTFFTNSSGTWGSLITDGILNIFDGDALVASDDPTTGGDFGPGSVSLSVTDLGNNVLAVTASGLSINLAAGTYFFGLSPSLPSDTDPQEFHYDSGTTVGLASQARNPGGGFLPLLGTTDWLDANGLSPGFGDAAFTITSEPIPEPTTAGLLALGLVGLTARRRR